MSQETVAVAIPTIGQHWPEQGGIYIGSRLIGGQAHHIVIAELADDIKNVEFANVDVAVTAIGEINDHNDWRAPEQEDLMLAFINAREHFVREGRESIYWSRTQCSAYSAWAVVFENGHVSSTTRHDEFRVRPFRSFIHSSI